MGGDIDMTLEHRRAKPKTHKSIDIEYAEVRWRRM